MSKFNHYMNSHFQAGGCRLIARARDECRNRDVRVYAMPGYYDCVGVSDGTDAWIAPASAGPFFKTCTGDIAHIMRALKDGHPLPPVPDAPAPAQAARKRVRLDDLSSESQPAAEPQSPRRNRVRL